MPIVARQPRSDPFLEEGKNYVSSTWAKFFDALNSGINTGPIQSITGTASRITVTAGINPVLNISSAYDAAITAQITAYAQPLDGDLTAIAALTGTGFAKRTGVNTWALDTVLVASVTGTANRITITGTATDPIVDISSAYVGQTSITTLGTITTGTWNGATIGIGYGGTGLTGVGTANQLFGTNAGATGFEHKGVTATLAGAMAGITTLSMAGDLTVSKANSGGYNSIFLYNTSDTANSHSQLFASVGGVSAGDPFLTMSVSGGASLSIGIDNDQSDRGVFAMQTSLGDTNWDAMYFSNESNPKVTILNLAGALNNRLVLSSTAGLLSASTATWPSGAVALGDIPYGSAANVVSLLPANATNTPLFLCSVDGLAPSWCPPPVLGSLVYYWTNTASDIATYYKQLAAPFVTLNNISNAGVINAQLLATFATDTGNPNRISIPDGQYSCHVHAAKTAGTKDAQIYAEVWEVDSLGVDIAKIVTLGPSVVLTSSSAEYFIATATTQYNLASVNSRIVTKIYATITGGGSAPTIVLYMGGVSDSRTNLPAPIVDVTNFVPYTGAVSNVDLGSKTLTTTGLITGTNVSVLGTLGVTGVATFTSQPIMSSLTASLPVATDGSKGLVSITSTAILDLIGSTRGSLLYRGAAAWSALTPGTSGYVLKSNGAGADPSYVDLSAIYQPLDADLTALAALGLGGVNQLWGMNAAGTAIEYKTPTLTSAGALGGVTTIDASGVVTLSNSSAAAGTLLLSSTTAGNGLTIGGDVNLYRQGANVLQTDDAFVVSLTLKVSGTALLGSAAALTGAFGAAELEVYKSSNGTMLLSRDSADTGAPTLEFLKRRSAWGVVSSGDRLGTIAFSGADSVDAATGAQIYVEVDGTPGSNDMPGRIIFATSPDGSASAAEVFRLSSTGAATFTSAGTGLSSAVVLSSANPNIQFYETDGAPDAKRWDINANGEAFVIRAVDDAFTVARNIFRIRRTGIATTILDFGNTTDNATVNFLGAGLATFSGAATITGVLSITTGITPTSDDGAALGTTSLKFSDLFLATGAVINVNAGNTTITADGAGKLTVGGSQANGVNLTLAAGGTTLAPLTMTSGTNKTTPVAGDHEFDGVQYYATIDTTSKRGAYPVEQYFHLTAAGSTISSIANFFGSTSNISLVASAEYIIEIYCFFLNTTAGTVTWTFTNSAAPTSQNIIYEASPITGIADPAGSAVANISGQIYNDATAAKTLTATGTLTTAVNHFAYFRIHLRNNTGTSLKIQATKNVGGTITPGIGSWWHCRRVSPNNIGTFAA